MRSPALSRRALLTGAGAVLAVAVTGCAKKSGDAGSFPSKTLQLMAPAKPGGGWDQTARALQKALTEAKLAANGVEVYNVEGAAGTLGLAQLATKNKGDAHQLMVMGLVMVGGVVTNKSPVTLDQTTPIATLTAEQEVIVVPKDSPYQDLAALMNAAKTAPASVNWGGGSAGGTDQILIGLLAKAAGADPKAMKYVAYSGGGESKAALLAGDLTAAVSGVGEYADLVTAGEVRALAVSGAAAPAKLPSAPTIKAAGFDVELMNWRGLASPPGLKDDEKAAVVGLVDKLHASPQWQQTLTDQGWEDFYKSGEDAKAFFTAETQRIKAVLTEIGLA
ncbi:C4-dicarboxylate ABC transporter substrate-binding protein [Actinorhabdospora filicis]|uniref:C4-dicarboxylate ABC transporter substrate-binding protein n=1 Tax=Actinorhabdospora filicis TaxID=1785913 RepID=A0A9W6SN06_9ACTN|nr:tripartite tricarboxylate transporter substrate-binding protein [Actinorhabdospora filicis]GLZ79900.1 C4-dicarboxylate ABC transporter substrate-binding protein [Actinorhabdospora filicis]